MRNLSKQNDFDLHENELHAELRGLFSQRYTRVCESAACRKRTRLASGKGSISLRTTSGNSVATVCANPFWHPAHDNVVIE